MYELKLYTPDAPGPWIQCCIMLINVKFNTVEKFTFTCMYIYIRASRSVYAHAQLSDLGARAHPG